MFADEYNATPPPAADFTPAQPLEFATMRPPFDQMISQLRSICNPSGEVYATRHHTIRLTADTPETKAKIPSAKTEIAEVPAANPSMPSVKLAPFTKNNELDYAKIIEWTGEGYENWAWLVFIPIVIFIITAVSNGANLTDGIDDN